MIIAADYASYRSVKLPSKLGKVVIKSINENTNAKSVCYEVPTNYLIMCDGLTLSKSTFYRIRRLFFYLLDQNKH